MAQTLVIDNGASTLKAGYTSDSAPLVAPNAIIKAKNERKRVFIGPEIDECRDRTSLFYLSPFQKGYLGAVCAGFPNLETRDFRNDFCSLVVDSGYSFTHVVPVLNGSILQSGVKRINVGGKQLTNQLKEWISYRQMNMLEETYLINECKEKCCFVASDFEAEMKKMSSSATKRQVVREPPRPTGAR
uniref:Actin-related protein 6 n=1 Tax=Steinernema glaseri TaxID=37863 RepID=A0A1I8AQ45_9BILA